MPTYYQIHIPFFMWFSDKFISNVGGKYNKVIENENKPISNNVVFHTLLDIASISTPYLDSTLSVSSNNFIERERFYLNDHDGCTLLTEIDFKKQDIKEFIKRGLKF